MPREEFIRVIKYASTQPNIPLMSIKVTGFARFSLLEKLDKAATDKSGFEGIVHTEVLTYGRTGRMAKSRSNGWKKLLLPLTGNVGVLVDAEETWIQDPVDAITMLMMERFNREKVVVYNTIQLYRHDRLAFLKDCLKQADQTGFYCLVPNWYVVHIWRKKESGQKNSVIHHRYNHIKNQAMMIIMRRLNSVLIILTGSA